MTWGRQQVEGRERSPLLGTWLMTPRYWDWFGAHRDCQTGVSPGRPQRGGGQGVQGFRMGACSAAGKEALGNSLQVSPSAQKGPGDAGTRCCSQGHRHKLQHGTAPRKQPFLCKQGIPGTESEFVFLYCNCFDPINLPSYGLCHVAKSALSTAKPFLPALP